MDGSSSQVFRFLYLVVIICLLTPSLALSEEKQKTLSGLNLKGFEQAVNEDVNWQNNPFIQPTNSVAIDELKVTGIVYNEKDAAAIINDQIYKKGDKIGYNEVVDIYKNYIVLRNESGIFRLSLRGGK